MVRRDSVDSDVLKVETLIRSYINYTNSNAGIELKNMDISGNLLVDVLDNLGLEKDKEMEEYRRAKYDYDEKVGEYTKLEEKYKELEENRNKFVDSLELLLKNPLIQSIEKIKELLKETEQK